MIAQALDRLRGVFGAPDPRTPEELDADLLDEFSLHLDALEREALAEGADPTTARAEAARRFGDPDRIRAACRRVALEERLMLQRINAVLTVVLLLAVVALGVQAVRAQRANARTLDRLDETLKSMAVDRTDVAPTSGRAASSIPRVIYLDGDVARPGSYEIPPTGLSVQRLLAASGGTPSGHALAVKVYRDGAQVLHETWKSSQHDPAQDLPLRAGDLVVVTTATVDDAESRKHDRVPRPSVVRFTGPVRWPQTAMRLEGGSRSLRDAFSTFGGLALAAPHLEAVVVQATVNRPVGDGSFVVFERDWLGTAAPPDEPRLIAGDVVGLAFQLHRPPGSFSSQDILECSTRTLLVTADLVHDALNKAKALEPSFDWPAGTAARLEADLAAIVLRLRALGVEWNRDETRSPSAEDQQLDGASREPR